MSGKYSRDLMRPSGMKLESIRAMSDAIRHSSSVAKIRTMMLSAIHMSSGHYTIRGD